MQRPPSPTAAANSRVLRGVHEIADRWLGSKQPERRVWAHVDQPLFDEYHVADLNRYDLRHFDIMEDLCGRIVIDWGAGVRSWSQWTHKREKPIVEHLAQASRPTFPGFDKFETLIASVPELPIEWQQILASVSGVYLIVAPNGQQYVGSAYGSRGFLGRWLDYAENGHGGNARLRSEPVHAAMVRILRVMDPQTPVENIIQEENRWKRILGSRAFGLNAN